MALGPCPQTSRSGNPGRRAGPRSLRFCDSFLELFINIRVVGGVLSVSREGTRGRASVWGSGDRCFCPAQNHFPISGAHAGSICTRPGWSTDGNRKGLGVRCTGAAPGEGLGSHGPGRSPCWVPQQAPLPPCPSDARLQWTPALWPWAPRGVWGALGRPGSPASSSAVTVGRAVPGKTSWASRPRPSARPRSCVPGVSRTGKNNRQPQNPRCLPGRPPGAWSCCPRMWGKGHGHGFLTGTPVPTTGKLRPGAQAGRVQTPAGPLPQPHRALSTSSLCPSVCPCPGSVCGGDHASRLCTQKWRD